MPRSLPFLLVASCLAATSGPAAAQVVLIAEDFGVDGGSCPAFPAGWTRLDVDGKIPAGGVSWVDDAWVIDEDPFLPGGCSAVSTSWYSPVSQADDWMITPLLHVPMGAALSWRAFAWLPDEDADGYEVRYSTSGATKAGFMAHPALFSIADEETAWRVRSIDLEAKGLAGRAIHLAFRNNSFDDYLLYVDDIQVAFDDAVFREEFGGAAGGACDPQFPAGWVRHDVDGRTPDPGVAWVDAAWVASDTAPDDPADCAAFSTSAYTDFGQADDWMITPPIAVPDDAELRWEAVAFTDTPELADGYEVRWSSGGSNPSDFPDSRILFATAAESLSWTARSVDLDEAGLGGQTVRFAFRNTSTNKDLLAIDAVEVAEPILFRDGFESGFPGAWSIADGFAP